MEAVRGMVGGEVLGHEAVGTVVRWPVDAVTEGVNIKTILDAS